jgi:hypothetical protein
MAEKHKAWRELIEKFPDMPTPPNFQKICFDSTHKKFAEIINYEEHVLELFKKPEPDAVCKFEARLFNGNNYNSKYIFSSYEKALEGAKESLEREEVSEIYIEKIFINDNNNDKGRILALFDYDGDLFNLSFYGSNKEIKAKFFPNMDPNEHGGDEYTENFYIDIPAPFKCGDILIGNSTRQSKSSIFVHEYLLRDNPKRLERYLKGEAGDGSDLIGWGFFVNENGILYGDHTLEHDSFEYYRGKLKGKERLLHYVNLYLKKEISLPVLLTMQCRLMLELQLENNLHIDTHGCYIPEHLLAENRDIK